MPRSPPSPLPVLLPPEKGCGGGGLCSGLRIASPVDGISDLAVPERARPRLSLRGGRTRGRDNPTRTPRSMTGVAPAILYRTPNQCPGPSPSPLPVLLPPEKGRRGAGFCSGSRIASPRFVHSTGLLSPSITMDTNPDVHFDGPQWTRRAKRPDCREEVPLGCDSCSKRARRTEKDLCPHLSGHRSRQTIMQSPNHQIPQSPPITQSPAAGRI
jgi:hypothetical protein